MDEREFELINIIGPKLGANQRDLSRQMDLSLGMINMLMRRLVSKGYIRIKQLNKRKVEYILTPKGFTEKMRKSIKYTLKTINSMDMINNRLRAVLSKIIKSENGNFIIFGKSDFAKLVANVMQQLGVDRSRIVFVQEIALDTPDGFLLVCKENFQSDGRYNDTNSYNLIEELAKDETLLARMVA